MKEDLKANMSGKICLVTGATNGIGKAAAQALAQMGATVVIVGRSAPKTALLSKKSAPPVATTTWTHCWPIYLRSRKSGG